MTPSAAAQAWTTPDHRPLDLTWLRGLAALIVVASHLFHIQSSVTPVPSVLDRAGYGAVELFFVLSGTMIAISHGNCKTHLEFYVRRFARIFPLMWVVVLVSYFLIAPVLSDHGASSDKSALGLLIHLVGLQSTLPLGMPGFGVCEPVWTLSIEILFYVFFPLFLRVHRFSPGIFMVAALTIEIVWRSVAYSWGSDSPLAQTYIPLQLPGQLFSFSVGMFVATKIRRYAFDPPMAPVRAPSHRTRIGALALFFLALLFYKPLWESKASIVLLPPICGWLIYVSAQRIRVKGVLDRIGEASYSMYLWHYPILLLLRVVWKDMEMWTFFIVGLALTMVVAEVSHRFIEVPLNGWTKRILLKLAARLLGFKTPLSGAV
jgi:peptidoglycan/LPS O-acetylase OafA/YrhL